MVEEIASSLVQFLINNEMDNKKKMPQMKASRDKNKSQRISGKCINYLPLMQDRKRIKKPNDKNQIMLK